MGRIGGHRQLVNIGAGQAIEEDRRVHGDLQTTHGVQPNKRGLGEIPKGVLPEVVDAHRTRKPLARIPHDAPR